MKMQKMLWLMCLLSLPLLAKITPAPIFVDNVVLQRDMAVPVWGTAEPGEEISVSFAGQTVKAKAAADGKWMVKLAPLATSAENRPLVIKGNDETITVNNVLVGEVWLCSGQSNMEMPMWSGSPRWRNIDGDKYCAEGANAMIRFTKMRPYGWEKLPRTDFPMKWEEMKADNTLDLSACAFFFGHELQRELKIPIGLITSHWGGTLIEPWTPPCGFDSVPELKQLAHNVNAKLPGTKDYEETSAKVVADYNAWLAEFQKAVAEKKDLPKPPAYPAELVWREGNGAHQQPTVLYNRMIYPFVPFAFRGAIWYQGCSNRPEGSFYYYKMKALFNGWKQVFQNPDMKFYLVQLAPYNYGSQPELLPLIWEAQEKFALENAPAAGMAVINDVGNLGDIHPHDKLTVGKRLAALALNRDYGRKDIKCDSPILDKFEIVDNTFVLTFKNVESWKTTNNDAIRNFTIAGIDGVYKPADAKIDGAKLIVSSPEVATPKALHYMWHMLNEGNLFNEAGLPLGAFRCGVETTQEEVKAYIDKEQKLVYELDLMKALKEDKSANYVTDNSAAIDKFSRVCYYVDATLKDGTKQWLAVSMDAFTANVKEIGLPLDFKQAKIVNNLIVLSNVAGIKNGAHAQGNIEFWRSNYGTSNKFNVPGANGNNYDFGDETSNDDIGYGSMQVHLFKERQTLFAFNNHRAGPKADFGIGNNTKNDHPDWTFRGNLAAEYSSAKIYIYVK